MNTAKALDAFVEKRSHVAVWNWVQLFNPNKFYLKRTRVTAFIIGVTMLQIGSDYAWLWVAAEPVHKQILGVYISRHRNMLVAESFPENINQDLCKHIVYSDGGTWYPQACSSLGLGHLLNLSFEKGFIERTIKYFKDRTENFDDYYPCKSKVYHHLVHVYNWTSLFVFMHNSDIQHVRFMALA